MTWQKVIVYVLGGIALIVLGWLLHSTFIPKPTSKVTKTTDTLYVEKSFSGHQENIKPKVKPAIPTTATDTAKPREPIKEYSDTLKVRDKDYTLEVPHKVVDDNGLVSNIWDYKVSIFQKIIETKKDSIQAIPEIRYISLPFFLNPYFWSSLVLTVITALAIIF